jgi:hypothetical protein
MNCHYYKDYGEKNILRIKNKISLHQSESTCLIYDSSTN